MMLDSSSGKILSAKPVEASISGDVDTGITASASPSTSDAIATVQDSVRHPARTEAEVRFIVRVVAEEHIVIDGKVKEVKHLDEVTMLRGVSRIAWGGAKEVDKLAAEAVGILDTVKHAGLSHASSEPNSCEPTNETSMPRTGFDPPVDDIEMLESNEGGLANFSPSEYLTRTDTISSPDQVVPNNEERITSDVRQIKVAKDNNDLACDNETSTFISNTICETQDHQPESSYAMNEVCNHDQPSVEMYTEDQTIRNEDLDLANRDEAECCSNYSQMISDTLNDCVLNVDRESRQNEQLNISSEDLCIKKEEALIIKVEPPERLKRVETFGIEKIYCAQHNEMNDLERNQVAEIEMKPLSEASNIPPNNESTQETIPKDSDVNYLRENDAQADKAAKRDLTEIQASKERSDNSGGSTRRRKSSVNGSASKRVRQVNSKDLPKNCRGTRRKTENTFGRRDKAILSNAVAEEHHCYFSNQSRILAKWSDNHFYPGIISKQKGDRKFEVTFYDGARKDIADTDLIPVPNILGKQVRITIAEGYCVNAVVLDQLSSNGQPMFDVEYNQNGLVKKRVPLDHVFLTAEQGIPLINQPIKPDKKPDESMFAGVDLDNIVPFKRSRRLQEMEEFEPTEEVNSTS